jgi:hypothetical protein
MVVFHVVEDFIRRSPHHTMGVRNIFKDKAGNSSLECLVLNESVFVLLFFPVGARKIRKSNSHVNMRVISHDAILQITFLLNWNIRAFKSMRALPTQIKRLHQCL